MKLCGSNNSFIESLSWLFEIFLTLYIMYILTKFVRSKLKLMNKDYLDIILIGICFIEVFFLILELIFKSNYFFDFFIFFSKLQIAFLITGCLYFQLLIHKAKFAVRYFKYYLGCIFSIDVIIILLFFNELFFAVGKAFCFNYIFIWICFIGILICLTLLGCLAYSSWYDKDNENNESFNLICDEYYHLNLHIKKQLKVINKNRKYYLAILFVCVLSFSLDLISMLVSRSAFKEDYKRNNDGLVSPLVNITFSSEKSFNANYSSFNSSSATMIMTFANSNSSHTNGTSSNSNINNKGSSDFIANKTVNSPYFTCSLMYKTEDTADIIICLAIFVVKDLMYSIIILLVSVLKPSNNETSQAFIELT